MHLRNISLELLSSLKSDEDFIISCDSCQHEIHRKVKYIRSSINKGKTLAFCNNVCQGKLLKVDKTKTCEYCDTVFEYNFPTQKYCSVSCANHTRLHTEETKKKIAHASASSNKPKSKFPSVRKYKYCKNDYSSIYICTCQHCNFIGSYRNQQKYCHNCREMYYNGRSRYLFTFNIYNYPDLFDIKQIETIGWFNSRKKNLEGLSKDHKVSVNDSIKYNYDPYYIKHPLNCDIISMRSNLTKNKKSSITYEELVRIVDLYDNGPDRIRTDDVSG